MARTIRIPGELVITIREDSDSTKTSGISSKPATQAYADGWEALWGATADGQEEASLKRRHDPKNAN